MKKLFTSVLVFAMTLALSIPALAADTTIDQDSNPKTGAMNVTYNVAPTYSVTIPATVEMGGNAEISVSKVKVEKNQAVQIAITATSEADNAFKVANGDEKLTYTVTKGESAVNLNDTVLSVASATDNGGIGSATLAFNPPSASDITYAGNYTGAVTFTVSVS